MATARGIIIDGKEWIYTKNERIEMKRLYELRGERKVLNFFFALFEEAETIRQLKNIVIGSVYWGIGIELSGTELVE